MCEIKLYSIAVIAIVLLAVILVLYLSRHKTRILSPTTDNANQYLVQDFADAARSADMLNQIDQRINKLFDYLQANETKWSEYRPYIEQLLANKDRIKLTEASPKSRHTSYTVNKGEEIAICLRNPAGNIHDINTIMYVTIHELAHVACPEIGHTALFRQIFVFLLERAIEINIYDKVNYRQTPQPYCGIVIKENLLKS